MRGAQILLQPFHENPLRMRSVFHWNLGTRTLELGRRTLIMGIVNVTPDSFSDGGQFFDCGKATDHAERLLDEGADIIDIGGESTRPGARVEVRAPPKPEDLGASGRRPAAVTQAEEIKRVIPVIAELKKRRAAVVSIDTYRAAVAAAAVEAGAEIVNDISGFRWDPLMIGTLASLKCGAVLMHMRGRPEQWRGLPPPGDIVLLVKSELKEWSEQAVLAGITSDRMVLDPGFGFGKNFEENYPLISRFGELHSAGFPLLAGTSRKSFIGKVLSQDGKPLPTEQRLYGTLASQTALILQGAHIIRTHDVKASVDAARIADAILRAANPAVFPAVEIPHSI
jgi:dihydropteroate synthase